MQNIIICHNLQNKEYLIKAISENLKLIDRLVVRNANKALIARVLKNIDTIL